MHYRKITQYLPPEVHIPPEDLNREGRRFLSWAWEELPHFVVSGLITVLTKNPLYGAAFHAGLHAPGIDLIRGVGSDSGGLGAPAGSTPTAPSASSQSSRQGRESSEPGKHGVSRQSMQRRDRARRGECPKGHYWSYKHGACRKSKF